MRIVLVCGGRNYSNKAAVAKMLDSVHATAPIDLLVEGGASGADMLAGEWADSRGIQYCTVWALWKTGGKGAGPKRNKTMLDLIHPHECEVVAFPGGAGTDHMVSIARKRNIQVWEVSDDV